MANGSLAKFLLTERIRRGKEIKNYVEGLSISESYYRDLEAGRKLARVDTVVELCEKLDLDTGECMYNLLKDLLKPAVFDNLIKPSAKITYSSPGERMKELAAKAEKMQHSFAKTLLERPIQPDKEQVEYLNKYFELLPLIHFIYMRSSCSFDELKEIIERNNIKRGLKKVLNEFRDFGLAEIDDKLEIVRRYTPEFQLPPTREGRILKDKFFMAECETSTKKSRDKIIGKGNSYIYSAINCIDLNKHEGDIEGCVSSLIASFDAAEDILESKNSVPFFLSVIISSREEYDIK